jgi:tRNA 5-methylaminomethyl-2-thiouridine biosynthesis bifunctional protein
LIRVHKLFYNLSDLSKFFIKKLPHTYQSTHQIFFELGNVKLVLIYDDFLSLSDFNFKADTWYLDGFSPRQNPNAWTEKLFQEIYKHTNWRGSLSTFTVAGHVRRGLQKNGFCVSKTKGVGKKKEILFAVKNEPPDKIKFKSNALNNIGPVAIIGAGISGASLIYALRKRNIECFLIDKASSLSCGASGNKVALQMPKLTLDNSPYGLISLEAFSFSRKLASELKAVPKSNGLILLPSREREIYKFKKLLENNWPLDLIQVSNYNIEPLKNIDCLHMQSSGIVDNIKFIKNLVKETSFFPKFNVKKILTNKDGLKDIIDDRGTVLKAKTIVWANGYEMLNLNNKIPIIPTSGQVNYIKKSNLSSNLKINFSYGHFISQSFKGYHQIGASFHRDIKTDFNESDYISNLNSIPNFLKNLWDPNDFKNQYRVSVRASTKDRIPFFGSLNSIGSKKSENIYVLGGMGAWGFVYAPYYAELLVKTILNEPLVIGNKIKKLLHMERLL